MHYLEDVGYKKYWQIAPSGSLCHSIAELACLKLLLFQLKDTEED